jgi:ADP-ribose pyrophosphatase YjhB (NUDIX family)
MEVESTVIYKEQEFKVIYRDVDSTSELIGRIVLGVFGYCFFKDKLVIVYDATKGYWTPIGGSVEEGESLEEAVIREVHEEANMKVLRQTVIGYQDALTTKGIKTRTRSVCIVEPYGDFISDPDGDITEIKLIDPSEYKKYFDWGVIGDHVMERTLELKAILEQ